MATVRLSPGMPPPNTPGRDPPMGDPAEVVERQARIITMQSETISELYKILTQYMTMDALDRLPCVERLNRETEEWEEG